MAVRIEVDDARPRATGVTYVDVDDGRERFQRAAAVAVCGYSIESPRLLLHSTSTRLPARARRTTHDQVGRYVMVQGAPQVAGRFPELLRMYKGAAAGGLVRAVLRDRRVARLRARLLDPDASARCRSAGPSTCSPTATAARRCASTCATTTTGRCSARCASCCRCRRTGSRSPTRRDAVRRCRSRASTTRSATTTAPTSPSPSRRCTTSGSRRARRTCSRSTATRTSSAAAGWARAAETSVVDADHRVWGIPNLFVCDGSVMPTQGSANPALTIMALASRLAERLAGGRRRGRRCPGSVARRGAPMSGAPADPEVVVVTGASAGVGRAIAHAFARRGAHGRPARPRRARPRGDAAARSRSSAARRSCCPTDVADPDAGRGRRRGGRGALRADRRLGQRRDGDGLRARSPRSAPRSSRARPRSPTSAPSTARWRRCARMVPRDRGAIVQVGSALAYRAIPLQSAYCGAQVRRSAASPTRCARSCCTTAAASGSRWCSCRP